jgi:transcriptional regulator
MRYNPAYAEARPEEVRRLIAENPWATLVSHTPDGLVASHYPVLLDEEAEGLAIVTHVGRPDEKLHQFGDREILLIVAGPSGYISPSWYAGDDMRVPTWNFAVAHCNGVPQILEADENLRVLTRLVRHFESRVADPVELDQTLGASLSKGTVGLRLPITRYECKVKMGQRETPESQRAVLEALRSPGAYENPALADEMDAALRDRS